MKPLWLVLGDTHGSSDTMRCMQWAEANKVTTVIQVGDFGANWPGAECSIIKYFHKRQRQGRQGPALYTCGGNHDNYTKINKALQEQQSEIVELAPGCMYVDRGVILDLDGRSLLFLGGAVSSDCEPVVGSGWGMNTYPGRAEYPKDWKAARSDKLMANPGAWWSDEAPTPQDFEYAANQIRNNPCDVWITHDITADRGMSRGGSTNPLSGLAVNDTALRLKKLYDDAATKPNWWFHGHHHNHDDVDLYGTRIISCGIVGNKWGKNMHNAEGWLVDPQTMQRQEFRLR